MTGDIPPLPLHAFAAYKQDIPFCCKFYCVRLSYLLTLFKDAILSVQFICHGDRKVVMKGNIRRSCNLSYLGIIWMVTKNLCHVTEGLNQDSNPALV